MSLYDLSKGWKFTTRNVEQERGLYSLTTIYSSETALLESYSADHALTTTQSNPHLLHIGYAYVTQAA